MNIPKYLYVAPIVAWAVASLLLATFKSADITVAPDILVDRANESVPGFSTVYNSDSGRWSWKYAQLMPDGCTILMMPNVDAVVLHEGVITITLKSYRSDEVCGKPSRVFSFTGRISYDEDASFLVLVDGKQVYPDMDLGLVE